MNRWTRAAAVGAALTLVASCGGEFRGVHQVPLPGGADLGEHPYRVTAHFADVLDLVPQAGVKVSDVAVGRVEDIALAADGRTAEVTLLIAGEVVLPADAFADLRQSSLLGEKFVQLRAPADSTGGAGRLSAGGVIPVTRTNRNPEIEEALGALSMLLNGGGIEQVRTIVTEFNAALGGNEPQVRSLLETMNRIAGDLDGQKADIAKAIDALDRFAAAIAARRGEIATAVRDLPAGMKVVTDQRDQLVTMLRALDGLSEAAVDTINASREDFVADLKALAPTVTKLAEAGDNFPKALEVLGTFPFGDYALNNIHGDYFNADMTFDFDLSGVLDNLSASQQPVAPSPGTGAPAPRAQAPQLPLPSISTVGTAADGSPLSPLLSIIGGG
ncbi:phospholipid/cholesterol/gamma-HCH transport system substrate-binding protein [Actinokineospora alba]|uniref:Phospholipid/cholesterol/gamma-HCH transport system substrate-binding protein n=1 Tax=Actinokineospora alba TaxID=504798 RepID=A0A1H0NHV1_9PSEU|nr:MCE family protein [Actinokineospora alba]TDP68728.1 phospholipid/cholesterol/gamma-HCH transport system substrate-binding protein [Actinokineospora alba]SDH85360.1 phospholipid/cholesterol/gamma-HCH transport system substrate-binding protein [Actinokineospora alba]SDO92347.1 phospholipid/cholesterol/gamma-HCH transport system substrate-binding protein [Actinokineospora alba]